MIAEVHQRRAETAPPPDDALLRAQAAYNTAALLRGTPFSALYAHVVATHDGPSWHEVSAAFDAYDAKAQLGYVLRGIDVPLRADAAFVPVPRRDAFTASYVAHQRHVNKTFAKDAADGRVLLFSGFQLSLISTSCCCHAGMPGACVGFQLSLISTSCGYHAGTPGASASSKLSLIGTPCCRHAGTPGAARAATRPSTAAPSRPAHQHLVLPPRRHARRSSFCDAPVNGGREQ